MDRLVVQEKIVEVSGEHFGEEGGAVCSWLRMGCAVPGSDTACGVFKVPVDRIVVQEKIVEVPVEKVVYRDKIVEVPVDRVVTKEVPVTIEVEKCAAASSR